MNSDIDDWLEDLMGLPETTSTESREPASEQLPSVMSNETLPSETPQPVDLSEEALEEIFQEYGFHEVQDAEEYVEIRPVEDTPITLDSDSIAEAEEEEEEAGDTEEEEEEVNTEAPASSSPELPPPLPENSPTLLMDDSTSRFSGTEWYNAITQKHVVIAGVGGIGSNLAFQIARMHPAVLSLFDPDVVEEANMSGQLFGRDDIGKYKVSAIYDMLYNYAPSPIIYTHRNRFLATNNPYNIMMCGFDNMEARKTFFNVWKNNVVSLEDDHKKECLYLDGRLSIDMLQVFCITGDDTYNMQRYEQEFLFSDAEAEETVCSMKQTTYLASMIASLMTNLFVNFVANSLDPVIPYDLPFFTQYDAQNMLFKTER